MSIFDGLRNWFLAPVLEEIDSARIGAIERARNYRTGHHPNTLKVKTGGPDDNLTVNFSGLIVDRCISMMLGDGVKFDLPGDETTPENAYIKTVWDANKQEILLMRAAMMASDGGTGYIKIQPDGILWKDGRTYPRLIVLDPASVTIETAPEDFEMVIAYIIVYSFTGADGKSRARKQEIRQTLKTAVTVETPTPEYEWAIADYEASEKTHGKWEPVGDPIVWGYDFPPIVHWQNLPAVDSVYGEPDITDDVFELQDRLNFTAANISKIIRNHAHPHTVVVGAEAKDMKNNPDGITYFSNPQTKVDNLEMASDLASSMNFLAFVKQSLFSITRTTDLSSMTDRLGALTNFGLKVLYQDMTAKISTKRSLMGDALVELNHRLLVIGNYPNTDGGAVKWPDSLPQNEVEQGESLQLDLGMGLASRQTASKKRGYNWEDEQPRILAEKAAEGEAAGNIGEALLTGFNRGDTPDVFASFRRASGNRTNNQQQIGANNG